MDFVPEESAVNTELIEVLPATANCLISINSAGLASYQVYGGLYRMYIGVAMLVNSR